jgi:pimeloyl-ACP methyl ester carboxylesterase
LVWCHGYSLNLDCWHFQRAAYRGLLRSVFYDQRSHGRSGRSPEDNSTVDQLGRDLKRVLDDLTHDDPVVLIGHSMGGMTILSFAEQHPELFGTKVVGVALLSTTGGGLDPGRILFPMLPAGLGSGLVKRMVGTLSRGHRAVDALRNRTPFDVIADFFPAFASLDVWRSCSTVAQVPTSIICGTSDKITAVGHSRKLHARIHGSDLLECEGAGHMVNIERYTSVNSELDSLLSAAIDRVGAR